MGRPNAVSPAAERSSAGAHRPGAGRARRARGRAQLQRTIPVRCGGVRATAGIRGAERRAALHRPLPRRRGDPHLRSPQHRPGDADRNAGRRSRLLADHPHRRRRDRHAARSLGAGADHHHPAGRSATGGGRQRRPAGVYPGAPLDVSSLWEGEQCAAPDCAATARFSWHGDTLHALVDVVDDQQGTLLAPDDCKRHWRTDAVEITLDPKADAENTSSTFKIAALPSTRDSGPPCYARDADNHQGPGEDTAPGVELAATRRDGGYTVELAIPLRDLPGSVDPRRLGLNVLVYDSDSQDLTGQSRIGWSTWAGVQGDPYRWGRAILQDRPADPPTPAPAPVLPLDALSSVDSPGSIAQSVRLGTSLGGAPPAGDSAARIASARAHPGEVRTSLDVNGPGRVHLFVLDAGGAVLAERQLDVDGHGERTVPVQVPGGTPSKVLVGFAAPDGATAASAAEVRQPV
ncbi:sugar-binding protein [Saccharopolyspora sp. NPDC000359]|uniref:sugar-binding protein n=1 Tax=Saccharopolyspora sp. NPDC000359 TaxID=3154251 RepID=UPI0033295D8E